MNDQGIVVIASFISRNDQLRKQIAQIVGEDRFHLFYMNASLEYCRNNKPDLYEKAERGEVENLPGFDLEYEVPDNSRLIFDPVQNELNLDSIVSYLEENNIFPLRINQ